MPYQVPKPLPTCFQRVCNIRFEPARLHPKAPFIQLFLERDPETGNRTTFQVVLCQLELSDGGKLMRWVPVPLDTGEEETVEASEGPLTTAEAAKQQIQAAMGLVEDIGAHPLLTDAVVSLSDALRSIREFVEVSESAGE